MLSLQGEAEAAGAVFVLRAPVLAGQIGPDGIDLHIGGEESCILRVRYLVNAAGLAAPAVASSLRGFPAAQVPRAYFAKGNYFSLSGKSPFRHLVYPVPEPGGLGIHVTRDLAGQSRFGPDVEWVDRPDYQMDPTRGERFYAAIRRYWPGLPDGALTPAYAGVRPKISGPGEPAADFLIQGAATHGVEGLINLFGIESPGLTASLALARDVADRFESRAS